MKISFRKHPFYFSLRLHFDSLLFLHMTVLKYDFTTRSLGGELKFPI